MIKMIATDVDGTLLNDKLEFAPDFPEILDELTKRKIKFIVASGRSKYAIQAVFKKYRDKNIFYISDNGAYISDDTNDYFLHKMDKKELDVIMSLLLPIEGIQIILCGKNKAYFPNFQPQILDRVKIYYPIYEIVDDYKEINDDILKVAIYDTLGSATNTYPKIKDFLPSTVYGVVSSDYWADIMSNNIDKGSAIKEVQKIFNVSYDETMAFGDYFNDVEMLKNAKYSFAMDNSHKKVKEASNFTAPSNNDFGVCKVIKERILK